jgi:hypothetical protein
MSRLWEVVKGQKTHRKNTIRVGYTHIRKIEMDVHTIALHMQDKTIDAVDIIQGESEMILHLSDGSSVELIVDSIHMNVQDLDD